MLYTSYQYYHCFALYFFIQLCFIVYLAVAEGCDNTVASAQKAVVNEFSKYATGRRHNNGH